MSDKHPEVRRAVGLRQLREELLIAVLVADIHLRDDEYVVQRAIEVVVVLEERVEVVAPNAPIAARDEQHELVLGVRARLGGRERDERVGLRVVADVLRAYRRCREQQHQDRGHKRN